ncbi:hypothetical protein PoB_007191500 [Plakobranchus ocellatus]|uniref:Uncharacterized protein n=1 Tax=Plakobranchus ocellatus TaxID=259542 RepID=A0AAV4DNB8_9GAST|nr:hypothetical protein PoB_007191500 [Plakobranchus ocellatus]
MIDNLKQIAKTTGVCILIDYNPKHHWHEYLCGQSGKAVFYQVRRPRFESQSEPEHFFIVPLCPHSTKWVKGIEESNGNYLDISYAKNNQDPTLDSPMHGPSTESTKN